jgi:hypothetical protein
VRLSDGGEERKQDLFVNKRSETQSITPKKKAAKHRKEDERGERWNFIAICYLLKFNSVASFSLQNEISVLAEEETATTSVSFRV